MILLLLAACAAPETFCSCQLAWEWPDGSSATEEPSRALSCDADLQGWVDGQVEDCVELADAGEAVAYDCACSCSDDLDCG